jgi:hypothetical protein
MSTSLSDESIVWLASAIRKLPSDEAVQYGTQGYNKYTTQKDHWVAAAGRAADSASAR